MSMTGFNKYTSITDHTEDRQFYLDLDAKDMSDFDYVDVDRVSIDPSFKKFKDMHR